jgi:hypothetical protein
MERRIPVENNTAMPIYVGSNMIPPGEIRDLPISQVPPHLRPPEPAAVVEEATPDPLTELLEHNVKTVVAALDSLSIEQIEKLGEMEQAGAARRGVLSAIAEKLLSAAGNPAADPVKAKALEISALTQEQFDALTEGERDNYLNAAKAALAVPAAKPDDEAPQE